jgi:16S rRNA (uracil1498-N3)-methyltransferase
VSAPVFLVEPGALAGVAAGGTYVLDGAEGRHAGVVQRRAPGERVDVVDGAGVRLRGTVGAVDGDRVRLDVLERVDEPAGDPALVLVQALAKGDRDELAIEAATEVGADAVVPWQAERSVVVWRGDRAAKSRARWVGTVRAATKQARRAHLPDVAVATDTARLADPGRGAEVLVVVGPEGGISDRELALLTDAGARAVRLGPHVLRTSTAGPVALALLAERLGRWA